MSIRKIRNIFLIFLFVIVACLAWIASLPRHGRPNVSIKVLGYTNDTTGTRLAMIGVTNRSTFTIYVYSPTFEISSTATPGGYTNFLEGGAKQFQRFHAMLAGGESGNFTIPPPTNQLRWRLSFRVYSDYGTIQVIKNILRRGRYMPYRITGDWVESEE